MQKIDNELEKAYVYDQKQIFYISKVENYFYVSNEVVSNFKKIFSIPKLYFKNYDIELPQNLLWKLENVMINFQRIESKESFLSPKFSKKNKLILIDFKKILTLSNQYLDITYNLELLNDIQKKIFKDIDKYKNDVIGTYPILLSIANSLKEELFHLKTTPIQSNDLKNFDNLILHIKNANNQVMKFYNLFFKELEFKKIIKEFDKKKFYLPREIDIRNSTLISELKLKRPIFFESKIDKIMGLEEEMKSSLRNIEEYKKTNLIKNKILLENYKNLISNFKKYIDFTNLISKEINSFNKTKDNLNEELFKININLLDCESLLKSLPEIFENKYDSLIENYSKKANEYIKKYKNRTLAISENDYIIVSNFSNTITKLKTEIFSLLYLIKFIEQLIFILNKYNNNTQEFDNYLSNIKKSFLNGEITYTLRLILKVIELYNIYE